MPLLNLKPGYIDKPMIKLNIRKTALHATLLMIFWLIMSGMYDLFHVSLGVFSVITVMLINYGILNYNYFNETENSESGFKYLRLPYYLIFLLKEIIISALKVSYLVLHPKMPIKACIVKFRVNLPNMNAKVLLANSITLTPGTVSIDIKEDNMFIVHSFTNANTAAWMDYVLAREVAKLYSVDPERVIESEEIINSADRL